MRALSLVDSIPGWLRPEDADKLYELAHATPGPILEIGTYHGKSAVLMALAARDAGRGAILYTLDVDRTLLQAATVHAAANGVAEGIVFVRGTLHGFARAYPQLRPPLTFVDGDHRQAGIARDLAVLEAIVPSAGTMVFHDFDDPRNDDPTCAEVRVRPAVEASWVAQESVFGGVFGCCGLFTRRHAEPRAVAIADLSALGSVRDQYLHRVRYPCGRLWRRIRPAEPHG